MTQWTLAAAAGRPRSQWRFFALLGMATRVPGRAFPPLACRGLFGGACPRWVETRGHDGGALGYGLASFIPVARSIGRPDSLTANLIAVTTESIFFSQMQIPVSEVFQR